MVLSRDFPLSGVILALFAFPFQFTVEFDRLVALGVRGNLEAELRRLRSDVVEMQKHKADAEKRIVALARKNRDAVGAIAGLEKKVEALAGDKEALNALVASYQNIESEHAAEVARMRLDGGLVIAELGKHKVQLEKRLGDVESALLKSQNDAFAALENGYTLCWDRAVKAGYDMEPHTFARQCEDVARSQDEGANSVARGGAPV